MINISIHFAFENFSDIFDKCIKDDSIYRIKTDKGNVIMLSEMHYLKTLETVEDVSLLRSLKEINQATLDEFEKYPPWN